MKTLLAVLLVLSTATLASAYTKKGVGRTIATNGSQSDVQAAIDSAPDNGSVTVTIPGGTFDWAGTLTMTKAVVLAGQGKDATIIRDQNATSDMIWASSSKQGNASIYGIKFVAVAATPGGIFMLDLDRADSSHTVMVHDCVFDNSGVYAYSVDCRDNGFLFWNDEFIGSGYNGCGGISFTIMKTGYEGWNVPSTMGTKDITGLANTYVEDCSFKYGTTGITNMDDNSRTVFRHDSFDNASMGSHGQETSVYGARQWEIYDCTFVADYTENKYNMNSFFGVRGGTGVITGCNITRMPGGKAYFQLTVYSVNRGGADMHGGNFCPIEYPAPRQTGWGWANNGANWGKVEDETNPQLLEGGRSPGYFLPNGKGAISDPIYVWNNTGEGAAQETLVTAYSYTPDNCGNGLAVEKDFLQKGRDFIVDQGPKPGWTPYPYPHPLRTGGGPGPTPTPSATPPSPTPSPTATPPAPTPSPTVTPQPTPSGGKYSNWLDQLSDWIRQHPATPNNR